MAPSHLGGAVALRKIGRKMTKLVKRTAFLAAAATMLAGAGTAQAALVDLANYNAFVIGSYNGYNSDVQGRLAAGGAVSLTNYGVATNLNSSANGTNTLVAGGGFSGTNGQLYYGDAAVGGASSLTGFNIRSGTVTSGSPIDFVEQAGLIGSLAGSLGQLQANGATENQWGTVRLTGSNAGLNIFTVNASDLSSANNFVITAPTGSEVLVNVIGGSASMRNMGFSVNGVSSSDVLMNFYQAGSLDLGGIGIWGSILAPNAAVNFNNGQLNGLLVAASFNGGGELHNTGYTGGLLTSTTPVPEPASWAMMIAGFGLIGTIMRRVRRPGATVIA